MADDLDVQRVFERFSSAYDKPRRRRRGRLSLFPWVPGGPAPAPSAPVNTSAPVVSGETAAGSILATTNGQWTGSPSPTFTYQWRKDTVEITDETADEYTTVEGDVGSAIDCVVTATNSEGSASATSNSITVTEAETVTDDDWAAWVVAA